MVRAVPALVVRTMSGVAVEVSVALGASELTTLVLATTVAVPEPAVPVASTERAVPKFYVAPMPAAAFAVAVAPAAALRHAPAPATPVATPVATLVAAPAAPAVPAVGPSSSGAMVQDKKRVFTGYLPV